MFKWLIGLLAATGTIAAAVFFSRRNQQPARSVPGQARDSVSSASGAAADKVAEAADEAVTMADGASSAASGVADQAEDALGSSTG